MNRFLNPSPSLVDTTGLQMDGTNILLRPVCLSDVTKEYVAWLNDSADRLMLVGAGLWNFHLQQS